MLTSGSEFLWFHGETYVTAASVEAVGANGLGHLSLWNPHLSLPSVMDAPLPTWLYVGEHKSQLGVLAALPHYSPHLDTFSPLRIQSNPVKELLWNCSTRRGLAPKPTSLHVIVLPGLPRTSQSTFYSPTIDQLEVQTQQLVLYSGGYTQHAPDYWSHKSLIDVADLNGHKCGCCYSSCFT